MELTKEYLKKCLDEMMVAINNRFDRQTIELKSYTDEKVEELARIVHEGFTQMATKEELNSLKDSMDSQFRVVNRELAEIRDENYHRNKDFESRFGANRNQEAEIVNFKVKYQELEGRVERLEKAVL